MSACKCLVKICFVTAFGIAQDASWACSRPSEAGKGAREVLECFLRLDFLGGRLRSDLQINPSELTSWEIVPGYDVITLVEGYSIQPQKCAQPSETRRCFLVTFKVWAEMDSSFDLIRPNKSPKATQKVLEMNLVKDKWLLGSPGPFPANVSPSAVIEHLNRLAVKSTSQNGLLKAIERLQQINR